jgi:hypothetical protein
MRFLLTVLLLLPVSLAAQTFPYNSDLSEKAVNSIEDIAASLISDSFSPMTHFSTGDTVISAVPAYFSVDMLMKDPDIEGDNFTGTAFGAGAGHALTDNLMLYFAGSGMKMSGDLKYAGYGEQFGTVKNSADYTLISLLGGCGYDLISDDIFSIPVYFGANIQYYSAELKTETISWTDPSLTTYDVDMRTSGNGFLAVISGGIAVSAKIYNKFRITPYFLYIQNFNKTDITSEIDIQNNNPIFPGISQKHKLDIAPVSAGMAGLNIGWISESGFSVSVAMGSLLSSLTGYGSTASANGVEMKSIVMIFSYSR